MHLSFFQEFYSKSPATFFLAFLVLFVSICSFLNKKLFLQLILHPVSVIRQKQYYRVLTADLVNADPLHLLLNECMLYVFCSDLEEVLRRKTAGGSLQFLVIYLSSLIFASAIVIFRHYKDFSYSTTGTSGSIMGCMFGYMILDPNHIVYHLPVLGGIKAIYGGLIYILMLIIYQKRKQNQMINHEYHFYGAIGGILATLALHPEILKVTGITP